jgi:hypothetical protein
MPTLFGWVPVLETVPELTTVVRPDNAAMARLFAP